MSHEVAYHEEALPFLQAACGFERGELTLVLVYAFGSLSHLREGGGGGGGRWLVRDARDGVLRRGRQSAASIAATIRRPSDWANKRV